MREFVSLKLPKDVNDRVKKLMDELQKTSVGRVHFYNAIEYLLDKHERGKRKVTA